LPDEIALFRSDKFIGNDGISFLGDLKADKIEHLKVYELIESRTFYSDQYELRRLVK